MENNSTKGKIKIAAKPHQWKCNCKYRGLHGSKQVIKSTQTAIGICTHYNDGISTSTWPGAQGPGCTIGRDHCVALGSGSSSGRGNLCGRVGQAGLEAAA
jgi:hypothetical protein